MAHFDLPLNLPHAGRVAARIHHYVFEEDKLAEGRMLAERLLALLRPYQESDENPASEEAARVVAEASGLGRTIVNVIERSGAGHDRLGQAIRNLFECLELGAEGAQISLRAGENPGSALRPT